MELTNSHLLDDDYSNADGAGKNLVCRTACARYLKKSKRIDCRRACDVKYPPTSAQSTRREDTWDKKVEKKEDREAKREAGGGFGKSLKKVLASPLRLGLKTAIRLNLFGLAIRLYPAVLTDSEIASKGLNRANAVKSKSAFAKVSKKWSSMGGKLSKLKDAIKKGAKRKVSSMQGVKGGSSSFSGETFSNVVETATVVAIVTASLPVIMQVVTMIASSRASKNPYDANSTPDGLGLEYDYTTKSGTSNEEIIEAQKQIVANDPTLTADQKRDAIEAIDRGAGLNADGFEEDTIIGLPKPVFYIGLSVVVIGLIIGGVYIAKNINKNK